MNVPEQWWKLFGSSELDTLVGEALRQNPTVQAARASLRQAQETAAAARGSYWPEVDADYSVSRQHDATGTLSPALASGQPVYTLHTAQLSVSYLFDVFGGNRRRVESLESSAEAQRYELEGAKLTLCANVAVTAMQWAALAAQTQATLEIVASERESLVILRRQYELGSIPQTDVMAQEAAVAAAEASVPALQRQLEEQRHSLAVLTGQFPSESHLTPLDLASLELPPDLPLSVPADLVRQRPDVMAAEAQLHAATADVGVAIAAMLPQISLTAQRGGTATQPSQLFAAGNTFWGGTASFSQTLFSGGALRHQARAARAAMDEAGAYYRLVVLQAFQNVADSLTALQLDGAAMEAAQRSEHAAAASLAATRSNVENGTNPYLALLNAQQTYDNAVVNLLQARASRYSDTVALFAALGGGWRAPQ